jgi:hypothetical protein
MRVEGAHDCVDGAGMQLAIGMEEKQNRVRGFLCSNILLDGAASSRLKDGSRAGLPRRFDGAIGAPAVDNDDGGRSSAARGGDRCADERLLVECRDDDGDVRWD